MRKLIYLSVLAILTSTATAGEEQKVYKWEDADGNVYFGDSIPAEFAERPKDVLNDRGVKVDELEGKKTAEQLEQERIEQKQRVAKELQRRADMALLNTYLSIEEIVMHRDRRVELFQAQARVTVLYLKNLERRLATLREEASSYKPYSDDPDAPMIDETLAEELRKTKEIIGRHKRNLQRYEEKEKRIKERFDGDIERFMILKGIDERTASVTS